MRSHNTLSMPICPLRTRRIAVNLLSVRFLRTQALALLLPHFCFLRFALANCMQCSLCVGGRDVENYIVTRNDATVVTYEVACALTSRYKTYDGANA